MKILLCLNTTNFAGTERHVADLYTALRALGTNVDVAMVSGAALEARLSLKPSGIVELGAGTIGLPSNVLRLRKYLKANQDVIVHCHNGMTLLQAAIATWLAGCGRIVLTQHFLSPARVLRSGLRKWLADAAHKWVQRRIDHSIAISDAVKEGVIARREATAERVTRVHNGHAVNRSASGGPPTPPDPNRIFCASRLEREKRIDVLIDAMKLVVQSCPEARCEIAGDGNERAELRQQVQQSGLTDCVRLLGFCNDVSSQMKQAGLFVLPADAEPFGLVLLEAMSAGRAVIATDAGGPREIVVPGETGWLVRPGDPRALADAIIAALANPTRTLELGANGRLRLERCFTAERMARETIAVYEKVLRGGATPDR